MPVCALVRTNLDLPFSSLTTEALTISSDSTVSFVTAVVIAELIALAIAVNAVSSLVLLKFDAGTVIDMSTRFVESSFVGWPTPIEKLWSVEMADDKTVPAEEYCLETMVWAVANLETVKEWLPANDVVPAVAVNFSESLDDAFLAENASKTVSANTSDFVTSEESFDWSWDNFVFFSWIDARSDAFAFLGPLSLWR